MNKQRAKELLSACQRAHSPGVDPELQEALDLAASDPELLDWVQLQADFDPLLRDAVTASSIPADLEDKLLRTVRQGAPARAMSRRSRMRRLSLWGLAATLLVSVSAFWIIRHSESVVQNLQRSVSGTSPEDFSHFRDAMAYYIRDVYFRLDYRTGDLASIESWLKDRQAPIYENLPPSLAALAPIGCKQLQWNGLDVSLVCFHTEDGRIVHLFLLDRNSASPDQFGGISTVARSNGLQTGGWVSSTTVYLLVGSDPSVDIEFVLG